jgi:hypothetical protein
MKILLVLAELKGNSKNADKILGRFFNMWVIFDHV